MMNVGFQPVSTTFSARFKIKAQDAHAFSQAATTAMVGSVGLSAGLSTPGAEIAPAIAGALAGFGTVRAIKKVSRAEVPAPPQAPTEAEPKKAE